MDSNQTNITNMIMTMTMNNIATVAVVATAAAVIIIIIIGSNITNNLFDPFDTCTT